MRGKHGARCRTQRGSSRGTGKPVSNPAPQIWLTEAALTTALNTSGAAPTVG
jgi:hypothetical protein